jgi:hypothetical protein
MYPREQFQPTAPPPPYDSVVGDHRRAHHPNQTSNFEQFIQRYESECLLFDVDAYGESDMIFSQSRFRQTIASITGL